MKPSLPLNSLDESLRFARVDWHEMSRQNVQVISAPEIELGGRMARDEVSRYVSTREYPATR